MQRKTFYTAIFIAALLAALLFFYGRTLWVPVYYKVVGRQTVATVVAKYGEAARARLRPFFAAAQVPYPPPRVSLLALKDRAVLELWAVTAQDRTFIRTYPIKALSGFAGPKLREGDGQVPEGIYRIEGLNPNSAFHLSLKLDYPNAFDRRHAAAEGRTRPGSNIFIHGKAVSIGCLAMGDAAIEELFVLATDTGKAAMTVAIAPADPRVQALAVDVEPVWVGKLYQQLNQYFGEYQLTPAARSPPASPPHQ